MKASPRTCRPSWAGWPSAATRCSTARSGPTPRRISAIALLSTALLLAALCWAFIRRGVLLPLREAGMHFDRIAGGDLTSRVETRSNNEIGALFAALKRMQEA